MNKIPFGNRQVAKAMYGGYLSKLFKNLDKTEVYYLIGRHERNYQVVGVKWIVRFVNEWTFTAESSFPTNDYKDDNSNLFISSYAHGVRRVKDVHISIGEPGDIYVVSGWDCWGDWTDNRKALKARKSSVRNLNEVMTNMKRCESSSFSQEELDELHK